MLSNNYFIFLFGVFQFLIKRQTHTHTHTSGRRGPKFLSCIPPLKLFMAPLMLAHLDQGHLSTLAILTSQDPAFRTRTIYLFYKTDFDNISYTL